MAAPRDRRHIIVPGRAEQKPYTPHPRKITPATVPAPSNRPAHGAALKKSIEAAVVEAHQRRADTGITVHGATPGLYVQFVSQPGVPLKVTSLESATQGIEVVAVTHTISDAPDKRIVERATVFVPEGKVKHFVSRFEAYARTTPKAKGERRNEDMLDRVAELRLATLRALWTDAVEAYPADDEMTWWEVWLRRQDGNELARLTEFVGLAGVHMGERRLAFDDRIVTLVHATPRQLSASIDVLNDVAEVRRAKETAAVFTDMSPTEQAEWAKELATRTTPPSPGAPAVCILDTGVTRGHPLLAPAIDAADCHT